MGTFAEGRKGLVTGNDDLYLKLWHEVCMDNFSVWIQIIQSGNHVIKVETIINGSK